MHEVLATSRFYEGTTFLHVLSLVQDCWKVSQTISLFEQVICEPDIEDRSKWASITKYHGYIVTKGTL